MVCVRPGVLLVKASLFWPMRALIRLDFPTLLLPKNATSGSRSDGKAAGWAELTMNSAFKNRFGHGWTRIHTDEKQERFVYLCAPVSIRGLNFQCARASSTG